MSPPDFLKIDQGTLGADLVVMMTKRFKFDTGAGFNIIRR